MDEVNAVAVGNEEGSAFNSVIGIMVLLGVSSGVAMGLAHTLVPLASARMVSKLRIAYTRAMLRQDMLFFDSCKPGAITVVLNENAQDFNFGTSGKLVELIMGVAQMVVGLIVAFYFDWTLTLVVLAAAPVISASMYLALKAASAGGLFGVTARVFRMCQRSDIESRCPSRWSQSSKHVRGRLFQPNVRIFKIRHRRTRRLPILPQRP